MRRVSGESAGFVVLASVLALAVAAAILYLSSITINLEQPLFQRTHYLISAVFFVLSVIVFARGWGSPDWDPLAPRRLFFAEWFFILGLGNLRFSDVENPYTLRIWLIILSALGTFYVGTVIAKISTRHKKYVSWQELARRAQPQWSFERALYLVVVLFAICATAYVYQLAQFGRIPLLSSDIEWARNSFAANPYINRLALTFYVGIPLAFLCWLSFKRWKIFFLALLGFSAVSFILLTSFFFLANALLICGAIYQYTTKKVRLRDLALFVALAVGMKLALDTYRFYRTGYFSNIVQTTGAPAALSPYAPDYFYAVMNLQTFQRLTELIPSRIPYAHGWYVFYAIRVFWTRRVSGIHFRGRISDLLWGRSMRWFGFPTVTVSYLGDPYADFGWLGVIAYSLVLGWFSSWWYGRFRSEPTFWRLFVYSQIAFGLLISFFSGYFDLIDVYWALAVTAAFNFAARRQARAKQVAAIPSSPLEGIRRLPKDCKAFTPGAR